MSRKRRKVRDKRTNTLYQWPQPHIVMQAQQIGFNVVPLGFIQQNGRQEKSAAKAGGVQHSEFGMEWQIHFTKAEQLIQKHLNHPKLKCLIFALLLQKIFLDNAVSSDHIR
jgi:hypothetical protein